MAGRTKSSTSKRQALIKRLPGLAFKKKPAAGRRAKSYQLSFWDRPYKISVRYFRTAKSRRTKKQPQIVLPLYLIAARELAITSRRPKRQPSSALAQRLKLAATLPLLAGIIGVAYFGPHLKQPPVINLSHQSGKVLAANTAQPAPKSMAASTPVRLRIDKIGVAAPIVGLGLQPDGSLDTPPGPDSVGWYTSSPTPGQLGPSVIDGHVDWINTIAVFWRLRELVPGDTFQVERADGTTATFRVDSLQEFPQDSFPTHQVYGNINYAGIRLITCGGTFSTATHHYDHNIVVFGSLVQ